ncbi:hypothetical protein L873DRAFT_1081249 [Choiromyces venosus 120613-1]|uniref:Uncharacterized protein n=1 Tax=Choiromyces venosus 120613-1 TaxID=1336337 RepID=A0A3N4JI64_9PEZI|nr:hypothetical protein L873DRAFT_1081249 [Choiromyces venosus 120613-1]
MEAAGVLSSAFGLGMLLHASQAAFFSAINGHVKTLFLHRQRLVLLAFQLCISLYSIFQFASLLLLADLPCQIAVRFTLFFDQCARIAILGLGIWKVIDESAFKTEKFVWIVALVLRGFLGGVVVGFTQNNFIPVCFPEPTQMFVGYIAVGFDIALWILLLLRIVGLWGLFADQGRGGRNEGKSQGYGMFLVALSVLGWSVGSFPYLLKVGESIFVRMIPYILTLGLALGVLVLFPSIVFSVPPKSSDGFYGSRMQRLGSGGGGSPQRARSSSSPAFKQSPPQAGDIESNKHMTGSYSRDKERAARDNNVFGGIIGAPIVHPGAALPWSLNNTADPDSRQSTLKGYPGGRIGATSVALQENSKRKSLVETPFPAHAGGRAGISGPIHRDGEFAEPSSGISNPRAMPATTSPFRKVRTVSLRAAKEAERQRIDAQFERDQKKLQEAAAAAGDNTTTPTTLKSIPITPKSGKSVERTTSVKRKPVFPNDVPGLPSGPAPRVSAVVGKQGPQRNKETEIESETEPESPSSLRESVLAAAEDANWGAMRYSTNTFATDDDDTTRYTAFSNSPHPLRAPPREAGSRKAEKSTDGDAKVLFINEIVYDHPALVNSLVGGPDAQEGKKDIGLTTSRCSGTSNGTTIRRSPSSTKRPQLPTTQEVDEIPPVPRISASVMDRPRHIRKDSGRGIFPPARDSEIALEMKLKKSVNTSKSLPPPPPPTEPLPPLPVQSEELPVPVTAPAEVPAGKKVEKKPTELVFPIPPSRAPSTRKPAPPPITIEPPALVSPEVVHRVPSPLLTEPKPQPQGQRLSVAPTVPERSESRISIISPFLEDGIDSAAVSDIAYETAKAWIASVASVRISTGAPVLVNIEGGHRVSYPKDSDEDSLDITPLPPLIYSEDNSSFRSSGVSDFTSSTVLRKSVFSFIVSPKVTRDDGDITDVEIDSDSEIEDEEDNYEEDRDSSSDTERTQSEAGEMIGAGGEGYSTEGYEGDEEYMTESDSQEFSNHRDEVFISGMDDGTEFGKVEMTERKLNAKIDAIANAIPNMSAFPRHFNIGDHIPTFSESRRKYGSKRKPPPSPLGFLMRQKRMSRQPPNLQDRIQARLTMLAGNVSRNVAVLDDLLAKIPADTKSNRNTQASLASDGRNSLIAKLEQEMGQQENQWHGMQKVLQRNSVASIEDSRPPSRISTNLAQRRSLFEKLSSGIDRRLSTAQNSNPTVSRNASRATSRTTSTLSSMTSGAWQRQLAEAQIEYLQHAPWKSNNIATTNALVKPSTILKSQDTPVSVVSESEEYGYGSAGNSEDGDYEDDEEDEEDIIVYEDLEIESAALTKDELRRKSFYNNDSANFLMQHEGEETVAISVETASESSAYGNDEGFEEYEVEEYLETLPATVYSPNMQSEISIAYFSPSMKMASPVKEPAVSLLWNPQSISRERAQQAEEISLWSKNRESTSTKTPTRSAAIDVRPLQRVVLEPLTISSTELWKMPNIETLSPRSEVSTEICLSPSIKELSPNPDQTVSFLWIPPQPIFPQILQTGKLWSYRPLTSKPPIGPPAAIITRPHQRICLTPLSIYSTRLWCKQRSHPTYNGGGLWTNHKEFRPKSIITPRFSIAAPKTNRKSKRVTFVEEVVTVEPTGFFGKLKKLWGAQETVSVKKILEVPVANPTEETTKIQARSIPKEQEKPIADILQGITLKYQNKALPKLPTDTNQSPQKIKELWSKNSDDGREQSTVPVSETNGTWTAPSPKAVPRENEFKDNVSTVRAKPRVSVLSDLTSTQLWKNSNSSEVYVESDKIINVSIDLWSLPHKVHSPPKAMVLEEFDVNIVDAETADTSPPLESTTGLWKPSLRLLSDENSGTEEFTRLWPSANIVVYKDQNSLSRSAKFSSSTLATLSSTGLWALPTKAPYRQGLWIAPKKTNSLWPQVERVQKSSLSDLWPSVSPLPTVGNSVIPPHLSSRPLESAVVSFESTGLWKINSRESTTFGLWSVSIGRKGVWPEGKIESSARIGSLWTAPSTQFEIARRSNIKLVMTNDNERVMYKRTAIDTTVDITGSMWTPPEGNPVQPSGWLLKRQEIEVPATEYGEYITTSPTSNTHSLPEFVQEEPVDILPAESTLWTKIQTIATSQTSGGLWRYQVETLQPANRIPRARVTDSNSVRKTRRSVHRILAPANGSLWKKELADKSHPQLWPRFSRQNGLWNGSGSTASLTEIDAFLQNTNSLCKYAKLVFDDLSLVSLRSKRQLPTRPLKSAHGTLWVASIPSVINHENSDDIRGLWNSRWGVLVLVDQEISEVPPPLTFAQEEVSLIGPIRAHKHNLLWQPGDRPTQPAHSPISPVTSSKSNKRQHDSPLFLAMPPATGSMWTAPALKSNPCPPRLWEPSSVTLRGLWSLNNNTPSLAVLTRKNDPLWSKHNTSKSIFSTLTTESQPTFPTRPNVTISMAGPLWISSPVEIQQPQLWKPLKKTDEGLRTVEGTTPPLSQLANPKVERTPLWSKENDIIAPIFSDLSLVSLRSKRDISTKTLPVVEEGLWTKRINPPEIPQTTTGLWGTIEELPKVEAAPKAAAMLWTKENTTAPIFAHLPIDSARSKKDTSSFTLPVFTEPMWKKEIVLAAKPELWKPTPKLTGLWDATAKTKTLAQMSFEKKAKCSPLWKKEGARRTTNATPIRTNTAVRLSDNTALPKMVGGLWKPKAAAKPAPQLWVRRKSMKVEKQPVGVLLWVRETALRTTEATPERTKVPFTPSDSPLPTVSGNLWQKKTPEGPKGLWKRPVKTVSSAVLRPSVPLWSREKASRRTAAVPERFALVPKKTFLVRTNPPKASGTLWKPKTKAAPKGLWVKPAVIATKPIAIRTVLWTAASASRMTSAAPTRSAVPKRVIEEPLPVVSGNMWQKKTPEKPKGLWKREIKTVGAFQKTTNTPLWSKEGAARTTTAIPERAPFVPKPASTKPLEPATGDLWHPELPEKEAITLWKQKPVVPKVGVWNAEGTTPSLAEIKWELAARKDTLWQRRSVLAARGASEHILSNRSSFIQKKLTMDPIHLDTAQGDFWKPTESSADDDTSWMITNTPPTGTLSRTSTLSDMSEISPPTSAEDAYEPRIRTHSNNSSISSTGGLWQPLSNSPSSKKAGLWSNEDSSAPFVNLIGDIRAERIPLPAQREKPLETFDSSHNLWQPEILCDSKTIRSNSDASEYCTGDSVSEFSDDSFYSARGAHSEHGGEESAPSNVFVGQFRRDNYMIHGQASEQKLAEDSPFASHLRIPSLRRKLRPTEERKRRNTDVSEDQISEAESTEKVVAPSAGYLWSKGIV